MPFFVVNCTSNGHFRRAAYAEWIDSPREGYSDGMSFSSGASINSICNAKEVRLRSFVAIGLSLLPILIDLIVDSLKIDRYRTWIFGLWRSNPISI